jgi:hypothetical protein
MDIEEKMKILDKLAEEEKNEFEKNQLKKEKNKIAKKLNSVFDNSNVQK